MTEPNGNLILKPSAPHFGVKWEAGVKSVKFHLKRIIGDTLLTYEEFTTLLIQIEAILNSRPLTPCTDDPEDLNVLTPGHFIMCTDYNPRAFHRDHQDFSSIKMAVDKTDDREVLGQMVQRMFTTISSDIQVD